MTWVSPACQRGSFVTRAGSCGCPTSYCSSRTSTMKARISALTTMAPLNRKFKTTRAASVLRRRGADAARLSARGHLHQVFPGSPHSQRRSQQNVQPNYAAWRLTNSDRRRGRFAAGLTGMPVGRYEFSRHWQSKYRASLEMLPIGKADKGMRQSRQFAAVPISNRVFAFEVARFPAQIRANLHSPPCGHIVRAALPFRTCIGPS